MNFLAFINHWPDVVEFCRNSPVSNTGNKEAKLEEAQVLGHYFRETLQSCRNLLVPLSRKNAIE